MLLDSGSGLRSAAVSVFDGFIEVPLYSGPETGVATVAVSFVNDIVRVRVRFREPPMEEEPPPAEEEPEEEEPEEEG